MRAELPWNVAGIPPEAREAARAAARREGLSVGEWLTRRILRSFSDMGEETQPMPFERAATYERNSHERPGLDPWGLPVSAASRRDTEDMLARVSRSEAEASDSYRRIEEQLRNVGRRLDSAERSQSENNRAMSKTASEINIASREQAQAFDQLGGHVLSLSERLERLERNAHQDGLKDAVKGLHQGLSRLADQIGQTAHQSATQVSSLTSNLEQLATRLGQARADAENATRALEVRIASVENSLQFTAASLDKVQERIEIQTTNRAHDLAETAKREAGNQGSLERIEERIARLEVKGTDPAMERRLDNIERALSGIVARLEQSDPSAALADTLREVNHRLDAVEKNHNEMLAELRTNLTRTPEAVPPVAAPSVNPDPEFPAFSTSAFDETPAFEAPAFEMSAFEAPPFEASAFETPAFEAPDSDASPLAETVAPHSEAEQEDALGFAPEAFASDALTHGNFAEGAFANNFEMPLDLADALAAPTEDNFLSVARRSAKAAADAETGRDRSGFSWARPATEAPDKTSPRYVGILAMIFIALLVAAAALLFNQRTRNASTAPQPQPKVLAPTITPRTVVPVLPKAPAPASNSTSGTRLTPAPLNNAGNVAPKTKTAAPAPSIPVPTTLALVPPNPPKTVQPATAPQAAAPKPAPSAPKSAPTSTDKIAAAANTGNPVAETIIGLKYLDGQGIAADPVQALKWLQKAADAGQAVAQYRLGTMYERGQGVTVNPASAAKWYQASANLGNRKAMHNLAVAFAEGSTGKKDMAESARWFSKAAALGLSDSQFNLAVLYERGDGVPQSLIDAFKWYSIAAAAGDAESKTRLAVLQTQLSEADRAAATRSAQAFKAAPLNRTANVPPEPADISAN
ncbi:MAG: hypothetical protein ACXWLJ_06125 [Rhizomicrobium sp.]